MRLRAFLAVLLFVVAAGAAMQIGLPYLSVAMIFCALLCGFVVAEANS